MKVNQCLRISFSEAGQHSKNPPGDSRMWKILEQIHGPILSERFLVIFIEWSRISNLPTEKMWNDLLCFDGINKVELIEICQNPVIQVRRRGLGAEPIEALIRRWFAEVQIEIPQLIWKARHFEFLQDSNELRENLHRILALNEKSGIFHPKFEEARILFPNQTLDWSQIDHVIDYKTEFLNSVKTGRYHPLCRDLMLGLKKMNDESEMEPIRFNFARDVLNEVNETLIGYELPYETPPLDTFALFPKNPDIFSHVGRLFGKHEFDASLFDRPTGYIQLRVEQACSLVGNTLSLVPVNAKWPNMAKEEDYSWYVLGPWDARNSLIERIVEDLFRKQEINLSEHGFVLDGNQDWLAFLSRILIDERGYLLNFNAAEKIWNGNRNRAPTQRICFFRSKSLLDIGERWGIEIEALGRSTVTGQLVLRDLAERPLISLDMSAWNFIENQDIGFKKEYWFKYPVPKTPSYGFDKVLIFPEQYLIKVMKKDRAEKDYMDHSWFYRSTVKSRSVNMRNPYCSPFKSSKWFDGKKEWAVGRGYSGKTLQFNPLACGQAIFDQALRGVICLGATPFGGILQISSTCPEDRELAGVILAFEKLARAAQFHKFQIHSIAMDLAHAAERRNDIYITLHAPVSSKAHPLLPCFRMNDEVLYLVGPRPAYVDAGSKILSFVSVESNYITELKWDSQFSIYKKLHELICEGKVNSMRPIGTGGLAQALAEMSLWSGRGAKLIPHLSVADLFSAAPGRLVVGINPKESKNFEKEFNEFNLMFIGTVGGNKIMGLALDHLRGEIGSRD